MEVSRFWKFDIWNQYNFVEQSFFYSESIGLFIKGMCIIRVKRQSFRFFSGFWILFHQFLLWIWVLVRQLKEKILWKRTIKEDSNHYEIQSKCNFSNCCTSNERTLHDPGRLLTNMQSGAFVAQSIITILSSWVDTLVLFLSWSERCFF